MVSNGEVSVMEWFDLVVNVLSLVGGSAVFAAALPAKVAKYLGPVMKVVNVLGANVGNAKNKDA